MNGTMPEPDDEDLRRLFAELRASDRRGAPAFEALLASARSRAATRRARSPLLAAAAVLLVVAAGAISLALLHRRASEIEVVALSRWQSPTAFLLRMPGAAILESVPSVSASVINLDVLWTPPAQSSMQSERRSQ